MESYLDLSLVPVLETLMAIERVYSWDCLWVTSMELG